MNKAKFRIYYVNGEESFFEAEDNWFDKCDFSLPNLRFKNSLINTKNILYIEKMGKNQ